MCDTENHILRLCFLSCQAQTRCYAFIVTYRVVRNGATMLPRRMPCVFQQWKLSGSLRLSFAPFPRTEIPFRVRGSLKPWLHNLTSGMREEDRETTHEISLETRRETRAWQWLLSLSESLLATFCRRSGIELRQTSKESYL